MGKRDGRQAPNTPHPLLVCGKRAFKKTRKGFCLFSCFPPNEKHHIPLVLAPGESNGGFTRRFSSNRFGNLRRLDSAAL